MRLFVAIEIDDRARRMAEAAKESLRGALPSTIRARWVPAENMHLTVRFIGHVDETRAAGVLNALVPPLDIPPFDIELGGCGAFPPGGPPRALWIGLTHGLAALSSVHEALNTRLQPLDFPPEDRAFSAHLTVARIKDASREAGRAVRAALDRLTVPATRVAVSRVTIFESHLSSRGPRYDPIGYIPLNPNGKQ